MHGVLIIDKPVGPTSHDVVARLRQVLGTRAVGHAGTLDPAASGVLVIAVGQATKLVPHLTAHEKRYEATIALGTSTTTLDREGDVIAQGSIAPELAAELAWLSSAPDTNDIALGANCPRLHAALEVERHRGEQVPPSFSAIKQNGHAAHKLARRGEVVILPPRPVELRHAAILGASTDAMRLWLEVSKGYYVRSLARDLGESLNLPSHLAALRRLSSGPFTLDEALPLTAPDEVLIAALQTLAHTARRVLPSARLSEEGVRRARWGQVLSAADFVAGPPAAGAAGWFDLENELVAIGHAVEPNAFVVERGFPHSTSSEAI